MFFFMCQFLKEFQICNLSDYKVGGGICEGRQGEGYIFLQKKAIYI